MAVESETIWKDADGAWFSTGRLHRHPEVRISSESHIDLGPAQARKLAAELLRLADEIDGGEHE